MGVNLTPPPYLHETGDGGGGGIGTKEVNELVFGNNTCLELKNI